MKILIADTNELVKHHLSREFPFAHIAKAVNGLEAEKIMRTEKWDLLILDISITSKSALDVIKQLRSEKIGTPILVVGNHPEDQHALLALKADADGYISLDCTQSDLIHAVRMVLRGKKYIPPAVATLLADQLNKDQAPAEHKHTSYPELQKVNEGHSALSFQTAKFLQHYHMDLNRPA